MIIIGIAGKKGSGKDTVAGIMKKILGKKVKLLSFADPLKMGCIEMFGLDKDIVYGTQTKKEEINEFWNTSVRKILQIVGTELMKHTLPKYIPEMNDVWIRMMEKKIFGNKEDDIFIITDVRFMDEYEFVKKNNGLMVKIVRNINDRNDEHISENVDIPCDYFINNNFSLEELVIVTEEVLMDIFF